MVFLGKEWAGYLYFWANLIFGFILFYFLFFIIYVHIYNTINFLGSFQKSSIFFFLSFSGRVLKLRANYICFKYKFYIVRGQIQKFEGKRGWGRARRLWLKLRKLAAVNEIFPKLRGYAPLAPLALPLIELLGSWPKELLLMVQPDYSHTRAWMNLTHYG